MIRPPAVAHRFYEGSKTKLENQINACFTHELGADNKSISVSGKLKALISPHAGYVFSGPPASCGFARLKLEKELPERIILLGPKHTHYGADFAVSSADYWETPLGRVKVDKEFSKKIAAEADGFALDDAAHQFEHSLEVQLPFLQHVYAEKPFQVVMIAIGYNSYETLEKRIEALKKVVENDSFARTLFLISSDFSHDTPRELAYRLDAEVIDKILAIAPQEFYDMIISEDRSVCGVMPITSLLLLLRGKKIKASLLTYSTSMDIMEHERGVGYASIAFEEIG
jgi:AmmeMemoRadiSam system protein B